MKRNNSVARRCAAMRAAKERKRLSSSDEPRSETWQPPKVRRIIVVIDLDSGKPIARTMTLLRSNRIDTYRVRTCKGELRRPVGWSRALAAVRKGMPRASIHIR